MWTQFFCFVLFCYSHSGISGLLINLKLGLSSSTAGSLEEETHSVGGSRPAGCSWLGPSEPRVSALVPLRAGAALPHPVPFLVRACVCRGRKRGQGYFPPSLHILWERLAVLPQSIGAASSSSFETPWWFLKQKLHPSKLSHAQRALIRIQNIYSQFPFVLKNKPGRTKDSCWAVEVPGRCSRMPRSAGEAGWGRGVPASARVSAGFPEHC